jgi:hypothetical protein
MRIQPMRHDAGEPVFFDLIGLDIFDIGMWNGVKYTDADLDEMVTNFRELSAAGYDFPVKLGHGTGQSLIEAEELPAAAYIKRMYRKGTKLAADLTRVPEKVKTVLELGAYRTVSAEIFGKVQLLGKTYQNVLYAVAFLGGEIPAVGTLDDIVALYNRATPHPLVFSELAGATREVVEWNPKEERRMTQAGAADTVDDEAADLDKELTAIAERASNATKGKTGAPQFRAFLRETITKLRAFTKPKKTAYAPADMSIDEQREIVAAAIRDEFGSGLDPYAPWITEMYGDYVIVCKDGEYFKVPYTIGDDEDVTLGAPIEVEQVWQPSNEPGEEPAGTPELNKAGKTGGKDDPMAITKALATALGLPENADEPAVLKAIADLKGAGEKFSASDKRLSELEGDLAKMRAEKAVDEATRAKRITPAQREWAMAYAAKDPTGFAAFVEKAPVAIDTTETGHDGAAPEAQTEVAQFRAKVAEKVKAGATVEDAQRQVVSEEPELWDAIRARR